MRRLALAALLAGALAGGLGAADARANAYDTAVLADGTLTHYWNGTGAADLAPGGGATLACTGTCSFGHATASSLVFGAAASNYLSASISINSGNAAWTVAWWAQGPGTSTTEQVIWASTSAYAQINLTGSSGVVTAATNNAAINAVMPSLAGGYGAATLHFFVMECTGGGCSFYLDGVTQAFDSVVVGIVDCAPCTLAIFDITGGGFNWPGLVGPFQVYSSAMSQAEALALFQCGTGLTCGTAPPAATVLN